MNCKICASDTSFFYKGQVLNKYTIKYCKCTQCGFIQTEEPYWLKEAYSDAIAELDIGLLGRNIELSAVTARVIDTFFSNTVHFLDYGGGYGTFTRLMRDKGFSFYRFDTYCQNIFAKHFDITDAPVKQFDLVTAFEVFEHLSDPLTEIQKILDKGQSVLFSTLLGPATAQEFDSWWYRAPLSGQHVSFYTLKALQELAKKFNKHLYTNSNNLHLLTPHILDANAFAATIHNHRTTLQKVSDRFSPAPMRKSLIEEDYKKIEGLIKA